MNSIKEAFDAVGWQLVYARQNKSEGVVRIQTSWGSAVLRGKPGQDVFEVLAVAEKWAREERVATHMDDLISSHKALLVVDSLY